MECLRLHQQQKTILNPCNNRSILLKLGRKQDFIGHLLEESMYGSSLGRYVFGSEISYNKPPPRLPGLGC